MATVVNNEEEKPGQIQFGHERSPLLAAKELAEGQGKGTGVSVLRWVALFIFVVLSTLQNLVWICFSTILDDAKEYYNIGDPQVQRLVEISQLIFIPMTFVIGPISDRFGLRVVTIVGAALIALGGVARWLGGNSYDWLLLGQTLNGMAGPLISNAPPQLAAAWFPIEQRATATAIAWGAQSVGVAAGYLVAPAIAPSAGDIPRLMRVLAYAGFATLGLCCITPPAPSQPPSASASHTKQGLLEGVPSLARNRGFVCLLFSWGGMYGVCVGLSSLLDEFFGGGKGASPHHYTDTETGWVGFAGNGVGIVGNIGIPALVDMCGLQRHLKVFIVVLMILTTGLCGAFLSTASFVEGHLSVWAVSAPYIALSFTYGAVSPLVFELASELVFPVAEETAAAYLNIMFMVLNTGVLEAGTHFSTTIVLAGSTIVLAICTLLLYPIPEANRRISIDSSKPEASVDPSPQLR